MKPSPLLRWGQFLLAFIFCLAVFPVAAHNSSKGISAIKFRLYPDHVEVSLALSFPDMDMLLKFDKNKDDTITAEEIDVVLKELKEVVAKDCEIFFDKHRMTPVEVKSVRQESNFEIVMKFNDVPKPLVGYRTMLIGRLLPTHQEFVTFANAEDQTLQEFVLTATDNETQFTWVNMIPGTKTPVATAANTNAPSAGGRAVSYSTFVKSGAEHIMFDLDEKTGRYGVTDHLLFLIALLLMCEKFMDVLKIITSFTIAHSITLGLAAMGAIQVNRTIVEPLIAATIIYVGLENIFKLKTLQWRWAVTFAFGLIHGLGFAASFRGMFGSSGNTLMRLLSFNLGVELGQILVALVLLPIFWQLRKHPTFAPRWIPAASMLVVAMGIWWLVDRLGGSI